MNTNDLKNIYALLSTGKWNFNAQESVILLETLDKVKKTIEETESNIEKKEESETPTE